MTTASGSSWAILVAAGQGARFGGLVPKQFAMVAGQRVIDWSAQAAASACDGIVVVMPAGADFAPPTIAAVVSGTVAGGVSGIVSGTVAGEGGEVVSGTVAGEVSEVVSGTEMRVVVGGASRSDSVRCGLAAVPDDAEVVLVHDAARPLASRELFERVAAAIKAGAEGAVPTVAVVDTLRTTAGEPVDRSRFEAVQTPQGFRAEALRVAHEGGAEATDDATLVTAGGGRVVSVAGERWNLKVTDPGDELVVAALLGDRIEAER